MNQVNLEDMRLLVAVVQAGSLSQASDLTGIPISKLSRRLTQLENQLGTKIINRGKKGVSLNEIGEQFFLHAQNMLTHANLALSSLHQNLQKPSGLLRVSVAIDVAYNVLAPRLPEYLAMYPDVRIDINLNQNKINMIQDGIDVAIRAGNIENDTVVAKVLYPIKICVVATPEYLAQSKQAKPQTPYDLYQHQLITHNVLPNWIFYQKNHHNNHQEIKITPNPYISCNDFLLVQKMVSQHMGIGIVPASLANAHPEWTCLLENWAFNNENACLSVVYYRNRGSVPIVQSFVNWLVNTFSQ